jgi:hypothetical protein
MPMLAHSDDIAIDNPLGGIRRGADEPHKMYEGVFKSPANVHVVFWDYTVHQAGDMFWAVGRERGTYIDAGIDAHCANLSAHRWALASGASSWVNRGRKASC